jgi:hypothetical protein
MTTHVLVWCHPVAALPADEEAEGGLFADDGNEDNDDNEVDDAEDDDDEDDEGDGEEEDDDMEAEQ